MPDFPESFHRWNTSQLNPSPPRTDSATGQNHLLGPYNQYLAEVLIDIRRILLYNSCVKYFVVAYLYFTPTAGFFRDPAVIFLHEKGASH